jgi:WD40 repeat protein
MTLSLPPSVDGERLATASGDGTVKVWDITPDYEVTTYSALGTDILAADFSQDWSQLLTVDPNGFKIWNAATGALLREFNTSPSPGWNWTLAGNRLVTVDSKHLVTILDFTSGKELAALQLDPDIADLRQRISPDGKYVAISGNGGDLGLWEVATGRKIHTLTGHTDNVKSLAFS